MTAIPRGEKKGTSEEAELLIGMSNCTCKKYYCGCMEQSILNILVFYPKHNPVYAGFIFNTTNIYELYWDGIIDCIER